MEYFWGGAQVGLVLCFLLGPIFFALIQAAIEQGFRAGIMLGLGVWASDLMYIFGVFFGLTLVEELLQHPQFTFFLGVLGSLLLMILGLVTLLVRPSMRMRPRRSPVRSSTFLTLFIKGFALNAFNPFNLIFWLGVLSTVLIDDKPSGDSAYYFILGFITVVALTDIIKILLAKRIRRWMSPRHLLWFRRISGMAIVVFGIALLVRVLMLA